MTVATIVLAAALQPGGILAWIIVGLIAGFLASLIMRGGGYGIVGDIIVGIVGAFIGGLLADVLFPSATFGFWGSVLVALIGAIILIAILRAIGRSKSYRATLPFMSASRISPLVERLSNAPLRPRRSLLSTQGSLSSLLL